jgi:hypothetical protein
MSAAVLMVASGSWHPARAAGPLVRSVLPAGGQRGTTVKVSFNGDFPNWPAQAWVDSAGLSLAPLAEKGDFNITVAADAAPGVRWIRIYDADGAADPKAFVVGTLGELVEKEPNNSPAKAEALPGSTVVCNGRLNPGGDLDLFAVNLKQGQTLVASVAGHEALGSPMDAVLQIAAAGGGQLAFNHDSRGLDPEIIFAAPADGNYLVRIFAFPANPDSSISYAGNDKFVYRLTLTTAAFVDYPWPLAVTRSRETRVELVGWNIPQSLAAVTIKPEGESFEIADPQLGNLAVVAVEPHETLVETEPNEPAAPQSIALPLTITARIERPGDVDAFAFDGKKDQPLTFRLQSRTLGYPLDAVLKVTDAEGKTLTTVDDVRNDRDPLVTFSPPADGSFRILVSDLNRSGSSRHVYRLRAVAAAPTYEVTADVHAYTVTPEKPAEITLSIDRQQSFPEAIAFAVSGLPDFVTAAPAVSATTGDGAYTVKLSLTSKGGAFSGPIRIRAEGSGPSKLARTVGAGIPDHTARIHDLWLTATGAKK